MAKNKTKKQRTLKMTKLNKSKTRKNNDDERYKDIKYEYEKLFERLKECADKHKCTPFTIKDEVNAIKKCKTKKIDRLKCKDFLDIKKLEKQYSNCISSKCNKENISVIEFNKYIKLLLNECKFHIKKYNKKCDKFDKQIKEHEKEEKKLDKTFKEYIKLKREITELSYKLESLKPNTPEYKKITSEIENIQKSKLFKEHDSLSHKYFNLMSKVNDCYNSICKFIPKTAPITKKYRKYMAYY